MSQSWEAIETGEQTALNISLTLTVHRLTGSKEICKLLHKADIDVRMLNNLWAKSVMMGQKNMLPHGFFEGKTIHVTFDNSDGKQQTPTGNETTHHATRTILEISSPSKEVQTRGDIVDNSLVDNEKQHYGLYTIHRNRKDPPIFPDYFDEIEDSSIIRDSLKKDFA